MHTEPNSHLSAKRRSSPIKVVALDKPAVENKITHLPVLPSDFDINEKDTLRKLIQEILVQNDEAALKQQTIPQRLLVRVACDASYGHIEPQHNQQYTKNGMRYANIIPYTQLRIVLDRLCRVYRRYQHAPFPRVLLPLPYMGKDYIVASVERSTLTSTTAYVADVYSTECFAAKMGRFSVDMIEDFVARDCLTDVLVSHGYIYGKREQEVHINNVQGDHIFYSWEKNAETKYNRCILTLRKQGYRKVYQCYSWQDTFEYYRRKGKKKVVVVTTLGC